MDLFHIVDTINRFKCLTLNAFPLLPAPHSPPHRRRKKLNMRMKSFSLDTPEPPKQHAIDETSKKKSSSFTNACFGGNVLKKLILYRESRKCMFVDVICKYDLEGTFHIRISSAVVCRHIFLKIHG